MPQRKSSSRSAPRKGGRRATDQGRAARVELSRVSTEALQEELARRATELESRRRELIDELRTIDRQLVGCRDHRYIDPNNLDPVAQSPCNLESQPPLHVALRQLLRERTMTVTEVADAVQEAGYRTESENFRTIVNQTLIKHTDQFRRVSRGRYTAITS